MLKLLGACAMSLAITIASTAFAANEKFTIDTSSSQIRWEGKKKLVDTKHHGTVKLQSGELEVEKNEIVKGNFTIDLNTISDEDLTDAKYNQKLVNHLKSDDFFNVATHPTSVFEITSVKSLKGNKTANVEVAGNLTIKGISKPVKFPAQVEIKDGTLKGEGQLTIDRTHFGLKYSSDQFFKNLGDKVIHDNIVFDIRLVAKKS